MGVAYLVAWLLLAGAAEGAFYALPSLQASALYSGALGALVASLAGFVAATLIFAGFLAGMPAQRAEGGFGRVSGVFKPLLVLHGGFVMGMLSGNATVGIVAGVGLALMMHLGRGVLLLRGGLATPSGLVRREGQAIANWAPAAREGGGGERVDIYCAHPRLGSVPPPSETRRRLWDVYRDGEALVLGLGMRETIALSPDGRWLLTAGSGKVFLQNAITNSRLVMTGTSAAPAVGAGFFTSRDSGVGSSAVLLVRSDGACEEWQVSTGSGARRNPIIQSGSLARAYPSPLGDWVAVVDGAGNLLVIYRNGQHTRPVPRAAGQARVTAVAVSPSGTHLAVATVRQRDEASAEEKGGVLEVAPADGKEAPRTADGRYGIILRVAFNPAGDTLAWVTQRGIVYAWVLSEPAPRRLGDGVDAEHGVAFVDDASVGAFQGGKPIVLAVERRGEGRAGVALSPAAAALAAMRAGGAAPTEEEEDEDEGPLVVAEAWKWKGSARKLPTRALPVMAGGGRLVVGEADGRIAFWDLREGKLAEIREGHRGPIGFLRWDPGERNLYSVAVGPAGRTVAVDAWDVRSARAASLASSAVIHPDARIVPGSDWFQSILMAATGVACAWYVGANLHVVHVGEPSLRSIENEHRGPITCVALSPDGDDAALGHEDGVVRLWNVSDQQLLRAWRAHRGSIDDLKFSADGKLLVTMSSGEGVAVWDAHGGRRLWAAGGRRGMKGAGLTTVAITTSGDKVAVAARDGSVDVWTLKDSQQKSLTALKVAPWALAFGAKGDVLGGADQTGIIGMWDVRSATWLGQVPFKVQGASAFAVRSEPRMLAVGDISGAVRIWGPK